jgi:hypothetical protein
MGVGKGLLISFVSVLLAASLVFLGVLWSVQAFLYPQVYEHALNESGAYAQINLSELPGGSFVKLPSGGVPVLVGNYLSNTLSYVRGDSPDLNLTIEVDTSNLTSFLIKSAENFPVCAQGEEPFNGNTPVCRPAYVNVSDYVNLVMNKTNFSIPKNGQINLVKVFGINMSGMDEARNYAKGYQNYLYLTFALVIIFTAVIFFVSDSRTRWSGIDFVFSGVAVFIIGNVISTLPLGNLAGQLSFVNSVMEDLMASLSSRMFSYAYVTGGLGIIMFVLSFFIKKKKLIDANEGASTKQPQSGNT